MKNITVLLLTIFTGLTNALLAQDRYFTWTYESTTLPRGSIDLEPWFTFYSGRENFYNKYETRIEFETGLTDKVQTALYLNTKYETKAVTDSSDNITSLEKSQGEVKTEKEYILKNDLAYMYLFKPDFGLGLEARNHNEFVEGEMEHAAVFLGPTIFFAQKNFFAIINILPQVTNLKGRGIDLHEHEKFSARILLGISL